MTTPTRLRLSFEGPGALLADAADGAFSDDAQARLLSLAERLKRVDGVLETVPGMNNLMIVFDPLRTDAEALSLSVSDGFASGEGFAGTGRVLDVPVRYGGPGSDLDELAASLGLPPDEVIRRHSAPLYSVAAVGAMPGFVYLSGLDPALAAPRRAVPRGDVPAGAVMIGGAQTGIMPITAPSGWHILGHTGLALFSPEAERPALFSAGDRLRFTRVPE